MTLDNAKQALLTWMQRETGLKCIYAEQAEHRPQPPYGTVKFVNPSNRVGGIDELRASGSTFKTAGLRTATVSLNIFGEGANDKMSALRDTLDRPDVGDEFLAADFACIGEQGPQDLTAEEDTSYRERSQMDLTIQYAQERETAIGPIESVEVEYDNENEHLGQKFDVPQGEA